MSRPPRVPPISSAVVFALLGACSEYEINKAAEPEPPVETAQPEDTAPDSPPPDPVVVEDVWVLEPSDGVDIIIFGDTSGSMAEELVTMGDKVTEFVDGLNAYTTEWRLMAITGPTGCAVDTIFDNTTADYAARFAVAIQTLPGVDQEDEWGLYNVATALDNTDAGECNEGFLREAAPLHAIFLSDEDDNSPGWDDTTIPEYWRTYLDQIVAHKSDPSLVRLSAITGPVPSGCAGAEPGWGYTEAVGEVDGQLLSICAAWYDQIDMLVDMSVQRSTYALSQVPDPDSLLVTVNSNTRSSGWAYDGAANTVVFTTDIPSTGDQVVVRYVVAAEGA